MTNKEDAPKTYFASDYTAEEKKIIEDMCAKGMTDAAIAKKLGRSRQSILNKRVEMGILKRKIRLATSTYSKQERRNIEIKRYKMSPRYGRLDDVLTADEKKLFDEEFDVFLDNMDDIDAKDIENIHLLVMEIIRQNRILKKQKDILTNPSLADAKLDEEYRESVRAFERLMKLLKFSRQQRLEYHHDTKLCLTDLIEAFEEKENYEKLQQQAKIINDEIRDFKLALKKSPYSNVYGIDEESSEKNGKENE